MKWWEMVRSFPYLALPPPPPIHWAQPKSSRKCPLNRVKWPGFLFQICSKSILWPLTNDLSFLGLHFLLYKDKWGDWTKAFWAKLMMKASWKSLRKYDHSPDTETFWFPHFNTFPAELNSQPMDWMISDSFVILGWWFTGCQRANMAACACWKLWVIKSVSSGALIKYALSPHWQRRLCQHHCSSDPTGRTKPGWREIPFDPMTMLPSPNLSSLGYSLTAPGPQLKIILSLMTHQAIFPVSLLIFTYFFLS